MRITDGLFYMSGEGADAHSMRCGMVGISFRRVKKTAAARGDVGSIQGGGRRVLSAGCKPAA